MVQCISFQTILQDILTDINILFNPRRSHPLQKLHVSIYTLFYIYLLKRETMKRFFMSFIAIFFPWVIFLINDNLGGAIIALVLQATFIGWIPAAIWALKVVKKNKLANKTEPSDQPKNKDLER
jgi:uncharacterized membrane protein YqaE (UPF0057 family)